MKLENTIKMFKEIHLDSIILIKVGTFFQSFGKDSYILSYLLGYQLKPVAQNYSMCGFPKTGLARVLSKLEDMKINYIVLDKSDNYSEIEKEDFKSKNEYNLMYSKAHKYISKKNRIDAMYQYLIENISSEDMKDKIIKLEEIIYEK